MVLIPSVLWFKQPSSSDIIWGGKPPFYFLEIIRMINNILLAAAVAIPTTPLCAPVLAENITSPKEVTPVASTPLRTNSAVFSGMVGSTGGGTTPPTMSLWEMPVTNNIACRSAARSKLFELAARNMSESSSNGQWGTVNNMRALAWCRDNRVIISVAGYDYDSVVELRDEIRKAF